MKNLLIGYGYWGKKVAAAIEKECGVPPMICDNNLENAHFKTLHPVSTQGWDNVFITTPPETHYDLCKKFLLAGCNVWVEKPLTMNYQEAVDLYNTADITGKKLFVDETFLYDRGINTLKREYYDESHDTKIKDIKYFSERTAWGKHQYCGVVWDLLPHDLSIIGFLFNLDLKNLIDSADIKADITHNTAYIRLLSCMETGIIYSFTFLLDWDRVSKSRKINININNSHSIELDNNIISHQGWHKENLPINNHYYRSPLEEAIFTFLFSNPYQSYALDSVYAIEKILNHHANKH